MTSEVPLVEYEPETGFYRTEIDPADTQPVLGLIALLREIDEDGDLDTPLLYDVLDCDALNRLITDQRRRASPGELDLEFVAERFRMRIEFADRSAVIRMRSR